MKRLPLLLPLLLLLLILPLAARAQSVNIDLGAAGLTRRDTCTCSRC